MQRLSGRVLVRGLYRFSQRFDLLSRFGHIPFISLLYPLDGLLSNYLLILPLGGFTFRFCDDLLDVGNLCDHHVDSWFHFIGLDWTVTLIMFFLLTIIAIHLPCITSLRFCRATQLKTGYCLVGLL